MQPCGGVPRRRQLSVRVGTERPRQRDFDSRTRPVGGQAPLPHGQHAIKRAARKTMFRRLCLVVAAATAAQIAGDAKRARRGPSQALRRMKRFAAASGPIATLPARRNEAFFPKKKKPFRAAQGKKPGCPPRPTKQTSAVAMELALAAPRPARPAVGLRSGLFRGSLLGDLLSSLGGCLLGDLLHGLLGDLLCHDHISFNPVLSPPARLGILRPAATSADEQLANTTGRAAAHQNGIEAPKQIAATAKRRTSLRERSRQSSDWGRITRPRFDACPENCFGECEAACELPSVVLMFYRFSKF